MLKTVNKLSGKMEKRYWYIIHVHVCTLVNPNFKEGSAAQG